MASPLHKDDYRMQLSAAVAIQDSVSALKTLQPVYKGILNSLVHDPTWEKMDTLLIDSLMFAHDVSLKMTDITTEVTGCLCDCYRLCRNMLAMNQENQTLLHKSSLLDKTGTMLRRVLSLPGLETSAELLLLLRCGVQFIGNYCSGNSNNQLHIWQDFHDIFRDLLQIEDSKVRDYTLMVLHLILAGFPSSPLGLITVDSIQWDLLKSIITIASQTESENGLLVVEDVIKLPDSCEHLLHGLSDSARLLLLEVLINTLKRLPEDDSSVGEMRTVDIPAVGNIQYIAADFLHQSHLIPNMTSDDRSHTRALCTVKELECLCLATSHHSHYNILQDNDALLRVSVSLLQTIEDVGRGGNNVFTNSDKISAHRQIDLDHPVFGLKRDLIRLLGNLVYKHRANQDLIRELGGIPLILNQTNIDGKNPFITQWAVFASHNLTENNEENQQFIAGLKMEGLANNQSVLEEMGLSAERDGDRIVVKKKRIE